MNNILPSTILWLSIVTIAGLVDAASRVHPETVRIDGPQASQQIVVSVATGDGRHRDLTRELKFQFSTPGVASIDSRGVVQPLSNGETLLVVQSGEQHHTVPIQVRGLVNPKSVSFLHDIIPVFTKSGCNAGNCHGKAEGQNGFKLSVFGSDPQTDYRAVVREGSGRRVSILNPEESLVLLKGTGGIPHGGGKRFNINDSRARLLHRWIQEGATLDSTNTSDLGIATLRVDPQQIVLWPGAQYQLRALGISQAGAERCVTALAQYESNTEAVATVDEGGLISTSHVAGEAAILVRYLHHVAVCRVTVPRPQVTFSRPPENNFIDQHVWDKLQRLGIEPSGLADDAMFLRRVYLDTIGTLPTTEEARRFLADSSPDKRSHLIDSLLQRDEYADYWCMRWLNLLRADRLKITPQGTVAMQRWLRKQFKMNRPFDEIARELITAQGNTTAEGPTAFYVALDKPDEMSRAISQLMLGVRIQCAQCHHHPSEKWSQADYVGLAGFFTGVHTKQLPEGGKIVVANGGDDLPHPKTKIPVAARALGAAAADFSGTRDRRRALAEWITDQDNPFFAKTIANRYWAHYFGRGLVEPIDDMRETNPATNEDLLAALTEYMGAVDFDLKRFTKLLLKSRTYQLSSQPTPTNELDDQNFSHSAHKTLDAEVLLDAISQVTEVPEQFNGWPVGYRAIEIWDNRMPSYFFRIFGRPIRATVCECERGDHPNMAQALHLLNSPEIGQKISHRNGRVRRLVNQDSDTEILLNELYLCALSRYPNKQERVLMSSAFVQHDNGRLTAAEDILWALMNSKEFVVNH